MKIPTIVEKYTLAVVLEPLLPNCFSPCGAGPCRGPSGIGIFLGARAAMDILPANDNELPSDLGERLDQMLQEGLCDLYTVEMVLWAAQERKSRSPIRRTAGLNTFQGSSKSGRGRAETSR